MLLGVDRLLGRNRAHESQDRVRGKPMAKIEMSAGRHVSAENPHGWGDPVYSRLDREGFDCLLPVWKRYADAGYKIAAHWEPGGQFPGSGAMSWFSSAIMQRQWSDRMKQTWPRYPGQLRAIGLEPMFYLGVAPHHLEFIVEDLAFVASLGVHIVGLDYFSALVLENPDRAEQVISDIRRSKRTRHLTLITEGWLPDTLKGPKRAFFLRHMAQLEQIRGSETTDAIDDVVHWNRVRSLPDDQRVIKGTVGIVELHGAKWKHGQAEACALRATSLGATLCDWRIPMGRSA